MIKLSKVSKLGDKDPKYGQKFWCEVTDSLTPVMFNSNSDFQAGDTISYEESENKTTKKNTPYLLLKKVKKLQTDIPAGKTDSTASQSVSGITYEQGQEIIALLKKLVGEASIIEDEEREIKLEDIPF